MEVRELLAHLAERAGQRSLEQRPDVLDGVRTHVADDPHFLGVAHGFVPGVVVRDADIELEFVRVDRFGLVLHVALDEVMQYVFLHVWDSLDAQLAVAPESARDDHFVALAAPALALHLAAHLRLVDLHDAAQGRITDPANLKRRPSTSRNHRSCLASHLLADSVW